MNRDAVPGTRVTRDEEYEIRRLISDRAQRLGRCRAVFDVETSEAYRALPLEYSPEMPARFRMVYQCASEQEWQITVYDEIGVVVCDQVSDGAWIEAGGKCWHIAYKYRSHEARSERWRLPKDEWREREEARRLLEMELNRALWPVSIASGHLVPYLGSSTECYRAPESGQVVFRQCFGPPKLGRAFSPWQRLRWRAARLRRPSLDINEYFGIPSPTGSVWEIVLDEKLGFAPVRSSFETDADLPKIAAQVELWEDPVSLDDGLFVPRVHKALRSSSDEEFLQRVTLVPEESSFGVNIPLNLRPVDRTKELVDW